MSCDQTVDLRRNAPENWSTRAAVTARDGELAVEARKLIDDVRSALDHDLGAAIRAIDKLAALLEVSCGEMQAAVPVRGGLAPWQQRKVRDHIARHLERSICVERS